MKAEATINKASALYVHIPFCNSICSYCDFCKIIYQKQFVLPYLNKLKKELESYRVTSFKTIYIGGGTPSSLDVNELKYLLDIIKPYSKKVIEYTFEANPESLSLNKIKLLKSYGINRISLGVESTKNEILKILNRNHDFSLVKEVINNLNMEGIDNYNLDLIIGLPNQNLDDIKNDMDNLLSLKPKHLSLYSLTVPEHTSFYINGIREVNDDLSRKQCDLVHDYLIEKGFSHYEISNYALKGYESKHNLIYWNDLHYVGVGAGASGYIDNIRYTNTKSVLNYIKDKNVIIEKEIVSINDDVEYFTMLKLRLENGFTDEEFKRRFNFSFIEKYKKRLDKLVLENLLVIKDNQIIPTYDGRMLLNKLILDLFS